MFEHVWTLVTTARICSAALLALLTTAAPLAAQTAVRSIAVSKSGSEALVTIEGTGPLPPPTMGALDGPPRIFLDFAGVRARTAGVAQSPDSRVKRVRVGLFSASPVVTRVVVDLAALQPHRVELAAGRVLIFIGSAVPAPSASAAPIPVREPVMPAKPTPIGEARSASAAAAAPVQPPPPGGSIPPVPPLPPPLPETEASRSPARSSSPNAPAAASRTPYRPPTPPPSSKDIEKYRAMAGNVLDRLKLQMPLLEWMESMDDEIVSRMPAAMEEFDRLRDELTTIKPPETLRAQHDMLLQGARLGSTAARLQIEAAQTGNNAIRRNGGSAAAGAALMLERAFGELGLSPQDNR